MAHGQEATRQTKALYNHSEKSPKIRVGTTATNTEITITIGVYTFANLVMNFSDSPLFFWLSPTILSIRDAAEFSAVLVVTTLITPSPFCIPLITSVPGTPSTGTLSPVIAEVSIEELPCTTVPSKGILSYGFTRIVLPILTFSAGTSTSSPFSIRIALSGLIFAKASIFFLERPTATSSRSSPN